MKETRIARNTLALLLLTITALAANVSHAKYRIVKSWITKSVANETFHEEEGKRVCHEVMNTINATPDFFDKVMQKGDAYILFESPFKREEIHEIPPNYLIAVRGFSTSLSKLDRANYKFFQKFVFNTEECKNYPQNQQACDAKMNIETFGWAPLDSRKTKKDLLPTDAFYYSTPTHFVNTEKTVGYIVNNFDIATRSWSSSYIVHPDGMPIPGIQREHSYSFNIHTVSIPIDIQGKTYTLSTFSDFKKIDNHVKKRKKNLDYTVHLDEYWFGSDDINPFNLCKLHFQLKR